MDLFELGSQIGNLDARVSRVENTIGSVDQNVRALLNSAAEKRGEKRVIAFFATAMGGVGSLLVTIILKMWEHGK